MINKNREKCSEIRFFALDGLIGVYIKCRATLFVCLSGEKKIKP